MTHRDPTDVILSVADLYADIVGGFTDHLDRRYSANSTSSSGRWACERALRFRDGGADKRFYDIDFRAMQADPIGEVRGLYALAGRAGQRRIRIPDARRGGPRPPQSASRAQRRPGGIRHRPRPVRPLFADYVEHATLDRSLESEERMAIDLTGGIDPAREQVFARTARRPGDAGLGELLGHRRPRQSWPAPHRDRGGRGELGCPRRFRSTSRFPDGRVFRLRENGAELARRGARRAADRARRGRAGVPLRRAVRHLDDDLRRARRCRPRRRI